MNVFALLASMLASPEVTNILLGSTGAIAGWVLHSVIQVRERLSVVEEQIKDVRATCAQRAIGRCEPPTPVNAR